MKKVTGIGGIFFKSKDPKSLKAWYQKHLGFSTDPYGVKFDWKEEGEAAEKGYTLWSPFPESTDYFKPSEKDFMINFRVDDLEALVAELKNEGVELIDEIATYDYGKFVHLLDPEGHSIELWEPID